MYHIFIPYLAEGAQGNELGYAVAGWRRHFKEEYHITVIGDRHPVVDTGDDISFIQCERVPDPGPGNYRPHIDHVHKFRTALQAWPGIEGFIYACDDMYAVNDFDIHDVRIVKMLADDIKGNANSKNGWQRDAAKTRALLRSEHLPVVNYICHLPVYYEVDKLLAVWDRYDCDHNSYIVEDIYFNMYFHRRKPYRLDAERDNLKLGLYGDVPAETIREAFSRKIWITNSPLGWSRDLDNLLMEHYDL